MARAETLRLHEDIKKEFERLSSIQELGVQKFHPDLVLRKVADKFYKSPKTIENIVFNRTAISKVSRYVQTVMF